MPKIVERFTSRAGRGEFGEDKAPGKSLAIVQSFRWNRSALTFRTPSLGYSSLRGCLGGGGRLGSCRASALASGLGLPRCIMKLIQAGLRKGHRRHAGRSPGRSEMISSKLRSMVCQGHGGRVERYGEDEVESLQNWVFVEAKIAEEVEASGPCSKTNIRLSVSFRAEPSQIDQ